MHAWQMYAGEVAEHFLQQLDVCADTRYGITESFIVQRGNQSCHIKPYVGVSCISLTYLRLCAGLRKSLPTVCLK